MKLAANRDVDTDPEAMVLNVQRMSTEDGPGLRSTVFLKGCSLACQWCHNPESVSFQPQLAWHASCCIGCHECDGICPEGVLHRDGSLVEIDTGCTTCGWCANACPSGALEILGSWRSAAQVFSEVMRDRSYFLASDGGVTVSGGEPTMWPTFVERLLQRCRAAGIATALDTSGMCAPHALRACVRHADLILYDVKEIDSFRHARFTGQLNTRVLANLLELGHWLRTDACEKEIWIRTPLIPGATATRENLRGIGAFLAKNLNGLVSRWELCAFNKLAADKYRRLGQDWQYAERELLTAGDLDGFEQAARESGVDPDIVVATGPTQFQATHEVRI